MESVSLLLLGWFGQAWIRREGKNVQGTQKQHSSIGIEELGDKNLRVSYVGAVGGVASSNEPTQPAQLSVDGIPLHARKHQGHDQHETRHELDHGHQVVRLDTELGPQRANLLEEVLWIEISGQGRANQAKGHNVREVPVVVLDFRRLWWERVRGKEKDVQRTHKNHKGIGVQGAWDEGPVGCKAAVDSVPHGDERTEAGHLSIDRIPAHC
mmetsp:Transcript_3967/g.7162  ORF Transcript_3967/g.7162 Transcript_3967/m.7162 type:complete len:211 (-) Transcript_3967:256-888(-)